jgi:UDP-glucuronate 4-epimerase
MSESYAHLYRIPLTGLRFFTVYGPWGRPDMAMWKFTDAILSGRPIQVFNQGDMYRDFTYIDDIVAGMIACLDNPPADDGLLKAGGSEKPHALYNIGNNRSEHLMKVIGLLEDACGRQAELQMLPMQPGDVHKTYADIEAIRRTLAMSRPPRSRWACPGSWSGSASITAASRAATSRSHRHCARRASPWCAPFPASAALWRG